METNLFPKALSSVTEPGYIPRLLQKDETLQLYKKYYFPNIGQKVKCTRIDIINNIEYYYLENDTYQYVFPYPITDTCYFFAKDKYEIMERHIVNSDQTYKGYQIKWWFFKHNYNKYKNFINQIDDLKDDSIYKIHGEYEGNKYVNCKIILKYNRSL